MVKTKCYLKGYSANSDNRKRFYPPNEKMLIMSLTVIFLFLGLLFGFHIMKKAPNTNVFGFPLRPNRIEMGIR